MNKKPVYVADSRGGTLFVGHASTVKGATTVASKYRKLCGEVYESRFGRFVAPVADVTEAK